MLFIPAIDLIDGKCVRLSQGNYDKKTQYVQDPITAALSFQDQGARYLHIIDLDAARDPETGNKRVIEKIVRAVSIPIQVGGGVRGRDRIELLLNMGVERVILGTVLVRNAEIVEEFLPEFGEKLVAGIDAMNGIVRVSGWAEKSQLTALQVGRRVKRMGFSLIIYTDISKDGMLDGPNIDGIRRMVEETGLPLIAAGGISSLEDITAVKNLEPLGVRGVISGKAIYEGKLSVKDACKLLKNN
jgi:phosphoribosylformimino-5-aminoimidazole carboxamide ribotide isomerase